MNNMDLQLQQLRSNPQQFVQQAGWNIPQEIIDKQYHNVTIAGEVPDARDFMLSKDIMIVPLLSGSGIRVKIIEGMALGKTIITTSIGAEGLAVELGHRAVRRDIGLDDELELVAELAIGEAFFDVLVERRGENA